MAVDRAGGPFHDTIATLSMTEIIRLQNVLSKELKVRFEKHLALGFSDIVGSTPYFARFGDEAGRRLQQRHFDFIHQVVGPASGRVVDTTGDGAFVVFPKVEGVAGAFIELQKELSTDNATRPRDQQLELRLGFHFGPVLTDGKDVTGDAVNLAARIAASAAPGEIRLTREAFNEFSSLSYRLSSRSLGPVSLKGIPRPVEILSLEWRDRNLFPDSVRVKETGLEILLPGHDTIRFGRLKENDGRPANDVVLSLSDEAETRKISRWHFELRRHPTGFVLRPLSDQVTEVDGVPIDKGLEVSIKPGTVARLGRVVTLEFFSRPLPKVSGFGDKTRAPE